MNRFFELDERLNCVSELVRKDALLADIGTDHAYLPIHLILSGKIKGAIACDIRSGPLSKARQNVEKYGLQDKITCRLGNGLSMLSSGEFTDVTICGMGGELIAEIIENAPIVKDASIRLILQPMTHQAFLRKYLLASGFGITEERLSLSDGKLYQCICSEYGTATKPYSMSELDIGRLSKNEPHLSEAVARRINVLEKIISGKKVSQHDFSEELKLLNEYEQILRSIK